MKILKNGLLGVEAIDKLQCFKNCKEISLKEALHLTHTAASLILLPTILCSSLSSLGKEHSPALNSLHSSLQTPLSYAIPLFHLVTIMKNGHSLYLQREEMQKKVTNVLQKSVFACNSIKITCKVTSLALCILAISNYGFFKALIKFVSSTNQLVLAPLNLLKSFKELSSKEQQENEYIEAILGDILEELIALQEPSHPKTVSNH